MSFLEENPALPNERSIKRSRKKKDKRVLEEALKDEDNEDAIVSKSLHEEGDIVVCGRMKFFEDNALQDGVQKEVKGDRSDNNTDKTENESFDVTSFQFDPDLKIDTKMLAKKERRKKRLMEQAAKAKNGGFAK